MLGTATGLLLGALHAVAATAGEARGALAHDTVDGAPIDVAWTTPIRLRVHGEAVEIPHCNGRGRVLVDGVVRDVGSKGPIVVRLGEDRTHDVVVEVAVSAYEKRVACSFAPRAGAVRRTDDGLSLLRFASPHAAKGGGEAVVFVPRNHDRRSPATVLVGLHPWNGSPWTYAAYRDLLEEAEAEDVVLLMPSGLGNSLYTADAEDEVMRAIAALAGELPVDPRRVSLWGASMGGAGATTIAFHRPDRFAFVASYFGDSKYDLSTYVRRILGGEAGAHAVNALDVVDNARHIPVLLIHGEDDRTSPIAQSVMLADEMKKRGFSVELVRAAGMGHEGPLVVKYIRRVVRRAAEARSPWRPARVSFRSVRASDDRAYGVRVFRAGAGDAFVDLERLPDGGVRFFAREGARDVVVE